jgi:hypothetical protein
MGRFFNNGGIFVNILTARNTGNSRRTAVSMRRPVNNFPLKNVMTIWNALLRDTSCDWLLGYSTIQNGRGFLCSPCRGYVTRAVSCRIVEAVSNATTVTLRIVVGDKNGSLKSETVKYGPQSKGLGPKKDWARASSTYKRQTRPLTRGRPPKTRP